MFVFTGCVGRKGVKVVVEDVLPFEYASYIHRQGLLAQPQLYHHEHYTHQTRAHRIRKRWLCKGIEKSEIMSMVGCVFEGTGLWEGGGVREGMCVKVREECAPKVSKGKARQTCTDS